MALRWKKKLRQVGLAFAGADRDGSTLNDGAIQYAATSFRSKNQRRGHEKDGWYWVAGGTAGIPLKSTDDDLLPDEAAAKAAAMEYVREQLRLCKACGIDGGVAVTATAEEDPAPAVEVSAIATAVEIPEFLREFVEAIAEGFTECHHQTQESYCSHCGANLDRAEAHKPDCMKLRARALLGMSAA